MSKAIRIVCALLLLLMVLGFAWIVRTKKPVGSQSVPGALNGTPLRDERSANDAKGSSGDVERMTTLPLFGDVQASARTQQVEFDDPSGAKVAKVWKVYYSDHAGWFHGEWETPSSQLQPPDSKELEEKLASESTRLLGIPNTRGSVTIDEVLNRVAFACSVDLSGAKRLEVSYIIIQEAEREAEAAVLFKAWGVEGPWSNFYSEALWAVWYPETDSIAYSSMGPTVIPDRMSGCGGPN